MYTQNAMDILKKVIITLVIFHCLGLSNMIILKLFLLSDKRKRRLLHPYTFSEQLVLFTKARKSEVTAIIIT